MEAILAAIPVVIAILFGHFIYRKIREIMTPPRHNNTDRYCPTCDKAWEKGKQIEWYCPRCEPWKETDPPTYYYHEAHAEP